MCRGQERPFGEPKAIQNALKNGTNFNQPGGILLRAYKYIYI